MFFMATFTWNTMSSESKVDQIIDEILDRFDRVEVVEHSTEFEINKSRGLLHHVTFKGPMIKMLGVKRWILKRL